MTKFVSYEIGDQYGFVCMGNADDESIEKTIKSWFVWTNHEPHFKILQIRQLDDYPKMEIQYHCPDEGLLTMTVLHPIKDVEDVGELYTLLYHKHNHKHCHITQISHFGELEC